MKSDSMLCSDYKNGMDDMANNNDKSQNPSIQGCSLKWRVQCPMKWENLELTDSDGVRFCTSCERSVYQVFSEYEAQVKADQGECIALFLKDSTVGLIGEAETSTIYNKLKNLNKNV